jgi:lipoprotein-releasing system permease protein
MLFELKVALRFLKEGRGQTVFILLGIAVGVAVQVFLNTLITGLQEDLVNQTVGNSSHIWIEGKSDFDTATNLLEWDSMIEIIGSREDIAAISPLVEGNGFIITNAEAVPIQLKGIELDQADEIYNIINRLDVRLTSLSGNQVLIGRGIADEYSISTEDVIRLSLPNGIVQNYSIAGIFDLGNSASNNTWVILDIKQAQKILGLGNKISKIEMQIDEIFDAEIIAEELDGRLVNVRVDNWIQSNSSLLSALRSQSSSSIMIQVFVLLAITLGIASVLAVSVVQKSKQLGILKAMGTKNKHASRIFLLQGALLGFLGALLGAGFGMVLIYGFLYGTSIGTGVPLFPLSIEFTSILIIGGIAVISSTIAAAIPARKTARLNAVEVIRNG